MIDALGHEAAASGLASNLTQSCALYSVAAALLPLAGRPLYSALGLGWGNSLLGFLALAFVQFRGCSTDTARNSGSRRPWWLCKFRYFNAIGTRRHRYADYPTPRSLSAAQDEGHLKRIEGMDSGVIGYMNS